MKNAASQTLLTLLSAGVLAIGSGCASTEMNTNKELESDMAVPAASPVETKPNPTVAMEKDSTPLVPPAPIESEGRREAPSAKTLTDIEIQRQSGSVSVVIRGDGDLSYQVMRLEGNRIVVDLADVLNGTKRNTMLVGHPLIKQIRIGSHVQPQQKVRLVFDLSRAVPYTVEKTGSNLRITLTDPAVTPKVQESLSPLVQEKPVSESLQPVTTTPNVPTPPVGPATGGRLTAPSSAVPGTERFTGRRISLDFQDADITSVLRLIADVSGHNMIVGEAVKGKISLKLLSVPWDQALDLILKLNQLGQVREGNLIWVDTLQNITKLEDEAAKTKDAMVKAEPMVTRIVYLNYADASKVLDVAKSNLSPRGEIKTDARTNSMIVRDIESNVTKVAKIVRDLDQRTSQVQIEARIVQASRGFARGLGVNWLITPVLSQGGKSTVGTTLGTFPAGSGATFGNATAPGEQTWLVNLPATAAAAVPTSAIGLTIGKFFGTTGTLDLRLSAGESLGLSKTVSAPKIITLDNKPAKIEQGSQVPFQTTSLQGTQTTFVDATLTLNVTPHIIVNDNTVRLEIKTTKNSIGASVSSAGPTIDKKEATTEILLRDGETTVLGGIFEEQKTDTTQGIPWFNRIPVLGWLFKNEGVTNTTTELLIFVTPTILKD